MDTTYHYVSIDADHDLATVELQLTLDPDVAPVEIEHTTEPTWAVDLDEPTEGLTRYWWRLLVGPGQTFDPTDLTQPLIGYGTLLDEPETLSYQWVLGDPEPDLLPNFANDCWPITFVGRDVETFAAFPADVQEVAKAAAVATLRSLTGMIVGGCPITLRPCRAGCAETTWRTYPLGGSHGGAGWSPALVAGQWLNIGCGTTHGHMGCGCTGVSSVHLPGPVGRIDAVWVGGVELDPSAYRLVGNNLLRTDGDVWPLSQDLSKPYDDVDAFAVIYLNAFPVDGLGALAAGVLAVEYGKGLNGEACRLPANVTQVQRAGVTLQLDKRKQSQTAAFPDGITGIVAVDAFVQRWNPHGLKSPSSVWSPDVPSLIR